MIFFSLILSASWVVFIRFSMIYVLSVFNLFFFFKRFIYLFLERGEGRKKERERNFNVWLPLVHPPTGGPGLQPRHVPWLIIDLVTFCFTVRHSIHWATPARVIYQFFKTWLLLLEKFRCRYVLFKYFVVIENIWEISYQCLHVAEWLP